MTTDRSNRFVILHHILPADAARRSHYDLMLEHDGVLLTWALSDPLEAGVALLAERLADHRLAYLDYEGEISGGRGSVTRWDRGTCHMEQVSADEISARLEGNRITGRLRARLAGDHWSIQIS